MNRIARIEVDHCLRCPHSGQDINTTRTKFHKAGGKMICWDGDSIEQRSVYIPDWCPLWVAHGKPMCKQNATLHLPTEAQRKEAR
jgi:hypothetical protein